MPLENHSTILVTGGAGFIGSNFIRTVLEDCACAVINLDALTYAGNPENLADLNDDPRYTFVEGDICNQALVSELLAKHSITAIVNFAAETHVDRSIDNPGLFVQTNINGTFSLLEAARDHINQQDCGDQFRFVQVSTDEVYGTLGAEGCFVETMPFAPNSPYSASKAAADHLVRAYVETFGLVAMATHCSNNYGPYQFPEKLLPLIIAKALSDQPLPIYGDGMQVRDWLFVRDHCVAIMRVLDDGKPGGHYNIGGNNEMPNLEVVKTVCRHLDNMAPRSDGKPHDSAITFVKDRPGHDRRYAIDATKIKSELGWEPSEDFSSGIEKTVRWYLDHKDWCDRILSGEYRGERLGLGE